MQFTKMHGLGNDYIYVNGFVEQVADPPVVARAVSDRHFGIGADGLILILPSERADCRMRMFNADGSEAKCVAMGSASQYVTRRAQNGSTGGAIPNYSPMQRSRTTSSKSVSIWANRV